MTLNFSFKDVKVVEFGVGIENGDKQRFSCVAVDQEVQTALQEIAMVTWNRMQQLSNDPVRYEPSEKYASQEYVHLPLGDPLATSMHDLHQANNLPIDGHALSDPSKVFCYFARMIDTQDRRLTALRRASQFKGVLKSRLIRLVTDALKLIDDTVFKLDADFDLLIDSENIHVLRPSGFEFAGKLHEAVLAAVPGNIEKIRSDLSFVDWTGIQGYASNHPRAARYVASIRSQKETVGIDKNALRKLCESTGVQIEEVNGSITVGDGDVMGFLEVLDRRRYELQLVKGAPERFRATSRRKLPS